MLAFMQKAKGNVHISLCKKEYGVNMPEGDWLEGWAGQGRAGDGKVRGGTILFV